MCAPTFHPRGPKPAKRSVHTAGEHAQPSAVITIPQKSGTFHPYSILPASSEPSRPYPPPAHTAPHTPPLGPCLTFSRSARQPAPGGDTPLGPSWPCLACQTNCLLTTSRMRRCLWYSDKRDAGCAGIVGVVQTGSVGWLGGFIRMANMAQVEPQVWWFPPKTTHPVPCITNIRK